MKTIEKITMLTDFGDFYPGVMKGVISRIYPGVKIVDITHFVEPQNIVQGAFLLQNYYEFFDNAVHMAVVDPGVGSEREPLLAESDGCIFVAPNNGILSGVLDNCSKIFKIDPDKISVHAKISSTFHGRDVFAPAAALAALGKIEEISEPFLKKPVRIKLFDPEINYDKVECFVSYIDRFGNVITDLKREFLEEFKGFWINDHYFPFVNTYSDVEIGEPLALIGSFNTLEFSLRNGSASKMYGISYGKIKLKVVA